MSKEELGKGGWKQASITGGMHLERTLEMYKELGLEIYLKEITPEECGGCTVCYDAAGETIYRIYTRRKDKEEEIP